MGEGLIDFMGFNEIYIIGFYGGLMGFDGGFMVI